MTIVNHATGEITTVSAEETQAIAMLTSAIAALTTAVDAMPIGDIGAMKAQVATVATATRELGMSKEAQELAAEAVRRAEWALGRAVRKGQEDGEIATHGGGRRSTTGTPTLPSPSEFASKQELSGAGHGQPGIYALADATEDEFEAAIAKARSEGNLSRANVVRSIDEHRSRNADVEGRIVAVQQQRRATRRAPLSDFTRDAVFDLVKAAERFERITNDDRFGENREAIGRIAGGQLNRVLELLAAFQQAIENAEATS